MIHYERGEDGTTCISLQDEQFNAFIDKNKKQQAVLDEIREIELRKARAVGFLVGWAFGSLIYGGVLYYVLTQAVAE